jgi:hypothetical protein
MASVYILYSGKLDRHYTGSCKEFQFRFEDHLAMVYPESFTSNSDDWQLFLLIEGLSTFFLLLLDIHLVIISSNERN